MSHILRRQTHYVEAEIIWLSFSLRLSGAERETRLLDDEAMCTFASMAGFHSELHICPLVALSLNEVRRESSRIIASALLFGLSLDELVL